MPVGLEDRRAPPDALFHEVRQAGHVPLPEDLLLQVLACRGMGGILRQVVALFGIPGKIEQQGSRRLAMNELVDGRA